MSGQLVKSTVPLRRREGFDWGLRLYSEAWHAEVFTNRKRAEKLATRQLESPVVELATIEKLH